SLVAHDSRVSSRHRRSSRVRFGRSVVAVSLALAGLVLAAAFVGLTVQGNAIAREIAAYKNDVASERAQQDAWTAQIANQKTADYVSHHAARRSSGASCIRPRVDQTKRRESTRGYEPLAHGAS